MIIVETLIIEMIERIIFVHLTFMKRFTDVFTVL